MALSRYDPPFSLGLYNDPFSLFLGAPLGGGGGQLSSSWSSRGGGGGGGGQLSASSAFVRPLALDVKGEVFFSFAHFLCSQDVNTERVCRLRGEKEARRWSVQWV